MIYKRIQWKKLCKCNRNNWVDRG